MYNGVRFQFLDKRMNSPPVPYIQFMMPKVGQPLHQALLAPASISMGPEEDSPLIIVDAMDQKSLVMEKTHYLRTDKA
jgi:hypothetical protein